MEVSWYLSPRVLLGLDQVVEEKSEGQIISRTVKYLAIVRPALSPTRKMKFFAIALLLPIVTALESNYSTSLMNSIRHMIYH